MAYRSWQLNGHDEVQDDVEDRRSSAQRLARLDADAGLRRATTSTRPASRLGDAERRVDTSDADEGTTRHDTTCVPLPVLLPLLGAGLALSSAGTRGCSGSVSIASCCAVVRGRGARWLVLTDRHGPQVLWVGRLAGAARHRAGRRPAVGADAAGLRRWSPSRCWSSRSARAIDGGERDTPVSIFHPTFLVLTAGVSNAFLAGDLFNLFVGFEILLFATLRAAHPRRHRRSGSGPAPPTSWSACCPRCCS